jgi:hypothetical protein
VIVGIILDISGCAAHLLPKLGYMEAVIKMKVFT